jgi:hypothetical protein
VKFANREIVVPGVGCRDYLKIKKGAAIFCSALFFAVQLMLFG